MTRQVRVPGGEVELRLAGADDGPFLREMLWHAAYWRESGTREPVASDLNRSDLVYLLSDWGRAGDVGAVALDSSGARLGAAWFRLWTPEQHSYGYLAPDIPELGIGVLPLARRKGVGKALVRYLIEVARMEGLKGISLSVEEDNVALELYAALGFERVEKDGNAWTMMVRTK